MPYLLLCRDSLKLKVVLIKVKISKVNETLQLVYTNLFLNLFVYHP